MATITSNFEKLRLKVATMTRVMMSKSVDDVRTGQPVEVERTAFIAFIEKEQVRKAPCFCIFSFLPFEFQYKVVFHPFPSFAWSKTDNGKDRFGLVEDKLGTLCVTIHDLDGVQTSYKYFGQHPPTHPKAFFLVFLLLSFFNVSLRTLCVTIQEVDGLRTSNGIQYRLQLLYSNGE